MSDEARLAELVDVERYPIDDPDGAGKDLIERCRRNLDESALCCLPGFVTPSALSAAKEEILALQDDAYFVQSEERTLYSWRDPSGLPADHAARIASPHRLGSITRDKFAADGVLNGLFERDELTEFIRRCLGIESLYRVECPYLSMNVKVMQKGAQHGWHFDANDGAVSLLVQTASEGGHYEYVPYIRSDQEENYERVTRVVRGEDEGVIRVDISPGTFCLFKGKHSMHRVSPVTRGKPDRLIALFAYDQTPGLVYNENTLRTVLGRLPGGLSPL